MNPLQQASHTSPSQFPSASGLQLFPLAGVGGDWVGVGGRVGG